MSLVFASMTSLNFISKWFCWLNCRAYLLRKCSFFTRYTLKDCITKLAPELLLARV